MRARIIGTGSCAPAHRMSNDDIAKMVDTNDNWIQEHTGIKERCLSDRGTVFMASEAARRALKDSGLTEKDLDMILVATVTPDYNFPNTACQVQAELGADRAVSFDLSGACSGFLFAMNTANAYICSGMYKNILVIGAETLSKIVDWSDRTTCILFGDGAGAVVMQAADTGILAVEMGCDGSKGMALYCEGRPLKSPLADQESDGEKMHMEGADVFKFAVRRIPETIKKTLELADMTADQVDYFVMHQANKRIIEAAARRLEIPMEKIPINIDRYGNTAAASIPFLLDEMNRKGMLKQGNHILISGFGAGLSWGSALIKW